MESQPQNPEFRKNPVNFHLCNYRTHKVTLYPVELLFVLFDSLHPSQQFFSNVGTGLPGLNQY